jgi:hypothetical protein
MPFNCSGALAAGVRSGVASSAPVSKGASWVGQVEQGELGAGLLAQPALQEGRNRRGRVVQAATAASFFGSGPDGEVGAGVGRADGDKKAGRFKAEGRAPESAVATPATSWLWSRSPDSVTVSGTEWPLMRATVGGLAVGKLDGEAQAEARAGQPQLVLADLVEEARAVAQNDGRAGDRVPDHVAKAAQAGERDADLVPVRVQGHVVRGADGQQALGGGAMGRSRSRRAGGSGRGRAQRLRERKAPRATGRCGRRRS